MTGNVVPAGIKCIRCKQCNSLYTTDKPPIFGLLYNCYEQCPICKCKCNNKDNEISAMKFKFFRWWRGMTK